MRIGQVIYQGKTEKGTKILIRYPNKDDLQAFINYINTLSKEQTFIRFQGEQVSLEEETKYLDELMADFRKVYSIRANSLTIFTCIKQSDDQNRLTRNTSLKNT